MRRSTMAYLSLTRSLPACLQLGLAAIVEAIYCRGTVAAVVSPGSAAIAVHFVEIILLLYPLVYFGTAIVTLVARWIIVSFAKEKPAYPCPVCGYDIHVTPHRCPECGTKLRWGQLP